MSHTGKHLLIDGDMLLYQCLIATEKDVRFDDRLHILASDVQAARDNMKDAVDGLVDFFGATGATVCLNDEHNFRMDVEPTYKTGRESRKPLGFHDTKEWMREAFDSHTLPHVESDDTMGILATRNPGKAIICSQDKDMLQIPGLVYRDVRVPNEAAADPAQYLEEVTPESGFHFFMTQTLTGDPVDGYGGCPGIGPVKAERILKKARPETYWQLIVETYLSSGLDESYALTQARLARILTVDDYDLKKKEVKLWEPSST